MLKSWVVGLMLLSTLAPVEAHHGYVVFDRKAEVTIKGVVTEFHWTNPHCVVEFEVKDDKGKVETWQAEMGSSSAFARKGWTPTSLEAGDEIMVTGNPSKNGSHTMWVTKLTSNGKVMVGSVPQ